MNDKLISVILPTRGRTTMLERSIMTMAHKADDASRIEFLIGFDDDDRDTIDFFLDNIADKITESGATYTALSFERKGYHRLNEYVNDMAKSSKARWIMLWNDDAIMESQGWDTKIAENDGHFRVLRIPTHNFHPYAIFPIVPKEWFDIFGYVSAHQLTDAWVSQIGYILDIIHNIDVAVTHDRYDLTGNNNDETYANRPMFEGRPHDPRDFNHTTWRDRRISDCVKLSAMLKSQGMDMTWFDNVLTGKQDPWAKMCSPEYDPNGQISKVAK